MPAVEQAKFGGDPIWPIPVRRPRDIGKRAEVERFLTYVIDIFLNHNLDKHHDDDVARGFKHTFIVPIGMPVLQHFREPIMFAQEQRVHHRDLRRCIDPVSACREQRSFHRPRLCLTKRRVKNGPPVRADKIGMECLAIGQIEERRVFLPADHLRFQTTALPPFLRTKAERARLGHRATIKRALVNLMIGRRPPPIFLGINV